MNVGTTLSLQVKLLDSTGLHFSEAVELSIEVSNDFPASNQPPEISNPPTDQTFKVGDTINF